MRHHELFVLSGRQHLLTQLAGAQAAVDQRHRHGLALTLAEGEPIAASEAWRFCRGSLELIDHLAFGERERAQRHDEADVFGEKLHLHLTEPDLAGEGMIAAITALR